MLLFLEDLCVCLKLTYDESVPISFIYLANLISLFNLLCFDLFFLKKE